MNERQEYASHKALSMLYRYLEILKEFLKNKNIADNINNCDAYFFESLISYLRHSKNYRVKYIRKIVEFVRATVKYAYEKGYTDKPPVSYKIPFKDETEITYLTEYEIEKLEKHRFVEPHLQRIADCFLVQCYTGLAYADLKKLSANNIKIEKDGFWIDINRQKVKSAKTLVPVLKSAKKLLLKYNYRLPVISNQRYNSGLKQIAAELHINKRLTTHVGRKTFGTLLLNKDVPIETVSKLLGHSNITVTQQYYANVLHMKVAKDLRLMNW
ncbi:MAG: site-specific integrase [Bacteroidales bacterium]|nr:site-specific integrase [Bacteroidales bacterium]